MLSPNNNQTVVLRVQLDEGKTEQQLQKLVLDIDATKRAQADLNVLRKAGVVNDAAYAQQTVALRAQLRGQTQEQTALTKNLDLYRTATGELANSYAGQQAQLSLAQRQYQQLAGSQNDSTESTKALSATIAQLRGELKTTDEAQGLFVRNVGNYPKGENLESLVRQLVKLQEETKGLAAGTEEASRAQMRIVGFQTQAAQAGAKEGKTYEETTNFIREYGEAIRPATADLVKLAEQQQRAAAAGEALGEEAQQIGFKIGEAQASIKKTTDALKDIPAQAAPAQQGLAGLGDKASAGLGKLGDVAAKLPGPLSGVASGLVETGKGLLTATKAALAFIATPLGLVLTAIAAAFYVVKEALTATDDGQEDLAAGSAALGAVLNTLKGIVIEAGKFIIKLFTDPKAAAQDLLDFVEGQVINRVKAYSVIFDGLRNGDFGKATDGVLQLATGVENVTQKTQALTGEFRRAATAAAAISREKDKLEDLEIKAVARNEQQRQQAERLVATAKDRNLTEKQRLANLDEASRLEKEVLNRNLAIERERLRIIQQENAESARRGVLQDDQRRAEAAQVAKLAQLQGEYEKEEQQRENRRSILQQTGNSEAKQAADKAAAARAKADELRLKQQRESLVLEGQLLDRQLKLVQAGSDEELSLLQQKLRVGYQTELAQKDLTIKAKLQIDRKYEDDSLALTLDFNRRRMLATLQAAVDTTTAALAEQRSGDEEAASESLRLQTELIEQQRTLALAALDERADNEAKIAVINAKAAQQRQQAEYAEANRLLQEYIDHRRQLVELDYAKGVTTEAEYRRQLAAVEKAGLDAQTVTNADYRQSNEANEKKATDFAIAQANRAKEEKKTIKEKEQQIQDAAFQAAAQTTDLIIENFGRESAAGQAALVIKKTLAISEIALNLQKQLSLNAVTARELDALLPGSGVVYQIATDALAIASAASATAAVLKLQRGGIADGPSHRDGGIPLYRNGQPAGIEIEGREVILTRSVTDNPLLLSIASFVNQAAGGRALVPNMSRPHLALGGVTSPALVQQQLSGQVQPPIDYTRLAQAMQKVNIYTKTQETMQSIENVKYAQNVLGSS